MPPGPAPGGTRFGAIRSDRFEHPSKDVRTGDRCERKQPADCKVFAEAYPQPEQRKDDDLRQQRDGEADDNVGDRLDQRHPPRLFHAARGRRSAAMSSNVRPSPSRVACLFVAVCQRFTATSTYCGLISIAKTRRPVVSPAMICEPEPLKGSGITKSSRVKSEVARIRGVPSVG